MYSKFKVVDITNAKKDVNDNANTSSGIFDTKVRDGSRLRSVKENCGSLISAGSSVVK